jgi:hypothetical protein
MIQETCPIALSEFRDPFGTSVPSVGWESAKAIYERHVP